MLFMVIEKFRDTQAVYRRARERGRMLPEGLRYVNSWVEASLTRCWQAMECEDAALLQEWAGQWKDLVEFEIVPVLTSQQASETASHPSASAKPVSLGHLAK